MRTSLSNVSPALMTVGWLFLAVVACDDGRPGRSFSPIPTAPTTVYVPPPVGFAPLTFTAIQVGEVVRDRIIDPPECFRELGWPCRYFRVTAPTSGKLEVALVYSIETNRNQGVDLTVRASDGITETWAQFFTHNEMRVSAPVVAGKDYYITIWYTFGGLEFELRTSLQ